MTLSRPTSRRASSRKKHSAAEARFDKAWNRVINQQKKNQRFREDLQSFGRQVSGSIQAAETAYLESLCQACQHLLSFAGRKSLAHWERDMLMDWVMDYLITITNNPFSASMPLTDFFQSMDERMNELYPDHPDFSSGAGDDEDTTEAEDSADADDGQRDFFDELEEELFNEFLEEGEDDEAFDPDGLFGEGPSADFDPWKSAEEQRRQEAKALQDMMKASSVSRLFRKVARVLHPDRERDESARREKNRLMGELLQAREANDIPRIFAFYAEHVGESPLRELDGDLESVTRLLQRQYEHLREEKEAILREDPVTEALYQRFHHKSEQAQRRLIRQYVGELEDEAQQLQDFRAEVTSLVRLRPYLCRRRDSHELERVFGFEV